MAGGVILVTLGFSWWLFLTLDNGLLLYRVAGVNLMAYTWLVCMVPLIFLVVGGMAFLASLIGKSQAELAAMRAQYTMPYPVQLPWLSSNSLPSNRLGSSRRLRISDEALCAGLHRRPRNEKGKVPRPCGRGLAGKAPREREILPGVIRP